MTIIVYIVSFLLLVFGAYSFAEISKISDREYQETAVVNSVKTTNVLEAKDSLEKEQQYMTQHEAEAKRIADYYAALKANHQAAIEKYQAGLDKGFIVGINWQSFYTTTSGTNWTDTKNP